MNSNNTLSTRLLLLTVVAGLLIGVAITIYALLTKELEHILFFGNPLSTYNSLPIWYLYAIPTLAIFFVNWLISLEPTVREYGVAEIAKAVEDGKFQVTIKGLILKIVASIVSLASGFNVGNEGPSSALGAMISHRLNSLFNLPKRFTTLIISIGASAGIASIFVSPVTGISFALENIAGDFVKNWISPIILASALAFGVSYHFLEPLIFHYSTGKSLNYDYIIASLLFIPVLILFLGLYFTLKRYILATLYRVLHRWIGKRFRNIFFAILGGSTIGTLLLIAPMAVFSGHSMVEALINGNIDISLRVILVLIVLRIVATAISIYANAVGGLFLPLMSIGALVGYGYAEAMVKYWGFSIHPYAFGAIGAGVFMGIVMKLPLTAVILALEITYDYNIIIPTAVIVVFTGYLIEHLIHIEKLKIYTPNRGIGKS